ncbi:MAG: hypothetical protein KAS32_09030 [Candidatus Peribacteraceae bacterium]|nr:hypothetical protein [Candidatus Peribacteraceae bacterium]
MARSLYEEMNKKDGKSSTSSKKLYALAFVVIVLVGVVGVFIYGSYSGLISPGAVVINTPDQAADTLSDLGNDISGISDDLEEMENLL